MNSKLKAIIEVLKGNAVIYNCELEMRLKPDWTIERMNTSQMVNLDIHKVFELLTVNLYRNKHLHLIQSQMRELPAPTNKMTYLNHIYRYISKLMGKEDSYKFLGEEAGFILEGLPQMFPEMVVPDDE